MKKVLRAGGWILLGCMAASLVWWWSIGRRSLRGPVNGSTVVRFFYLPPDSYYHPALMFRVAGKDSSRLGTAPLTPHAERASYITLPQMQNLIGALAHTGLRWQKAPVWETPTKVLNKDIADQMEITVFSSGGTYRALIAPKRLCEVLPHLDSALKEPRALWEFRLYRVNYGCKIPGFNRYAYPLHYEGR